MHLRQESEGPIKQDLVLFNSRLSSVCSLTFPKCINFGDALNKRRNEGDCGGGPPLWHRRAGRPPALEQKQKLQPSRTRQPPHQQQHPRKYRPQNQQNLLPLEQWTSEKQHGRSQVNTIHFGTLNWDQIFCKHIE